MKHPTPTLQEKYDWLCKQLEITDPDHWEKDATLRLKNSYPETTCGDACRSLYFQFSDTDYPDTIDEAVVLAMRTEKT